MYYHDKRLMYPVRVEKPDPVFAKMLQQGLGGINGEIRVVLQYLLQTFNYRGPEKYRNMLLNTGIEDLGHAEMWATAIALNLEGSPAATQEEAARQSPMVAAIMGGMSPRQFLSGGMGALATDSEGYPFDGSWVVSSGNIAADMYANVEGEVTNQLLASRLHNLTDDPGMKDMLSFLIARDTMHQQQWLAVIEELGGHAGILPIPNSFPQSEEHREFSYVYLTTAVDGASRPEGRFTSGPSLDGRGEFSTRPAEPYGDVPKLGPPKPEGFAQTDQMRHGLVGMLENLKDRIMG